MRTAVISLSKSSVLVTGARNGDLRAAMRAYARACDEHESADALSLFVGTISAHLTERDYRVVLRGNAEVCV